MKDSFHLFEPRSPFCISIVVLHCTPAVDLRDDNSLLTFAQALSYITSCPYRRITLCILIRIASNLFRDILITPPTQMEEQLIRSDEMALCLSRVSVWPLRAGTELGSSQMVA